MINLIFDLMVKNNKEIGIIEGKLNKDLFDNIVGFHHYRNKDKYLDSSYSNLLSKGTRFADLHNLKYMGELLERFEERNIVKDEKDLFTLIYAVGSLNHYTNIDCVMDQYPNYISKMYSTLLTNFDLLTSVVFLKNLKGTDKNIEMVESANKKFFSTQYIQLMNKVLEEMIKENGLSSTLLAIDCLNTQINDMAYPVARIEDEEFKAEWKSYVEKIKSAIETSLLANLKLIDMEIEDETVLFYALSDLYSSLGSPKASEMKTKFFSAFLSSFQNLQFKEITEGDIEKITKFLPIEPKQIHFLNYMIGNFKDDKHYNRKITGPGYERIAYTMAYFYLGDKKDVPEAVKKEICSSPALKNQYKLLLTSVDLSKNLNNFTLLIEKVNKIKDEYIHFTRSNQYIVDNEEFFKLMNSNYQYDLVIALLKGCSDEDFKRLVGVAEKYDLEYIDKYEILTRMIQLNMFNIYDFNLINTQKHFIKNVFQYVNEKNNVDKYSEYVLNFYQNIGLYNVNSEFFSIVGKLIKPELIFENSENGDKILLELLIMQQELTFYFSPETYDELIYAHICNDRYCSILGITEDEKNGILKKFVKYKLLSDGVREDIRQSFLTEEDKAREVLLQRKSKISKSKSFWDIRYYIKDEDYENEELARCTFETLNALVESENKGKNAEYAMTPLVRLVQNGHITEKELYDFMRKLAV